MLNTFRERTSAFSFFRRCLMRQPRFCVGHGFNFPVRLPRRPLSLRATDIPNLPTRLPRAKYSPWAKAAKPASSRRRRPFSSSTDSSTSTATMSARNRSCVPCGNTSVTRHSNASGHSAISGQDTACAGSGVKCAARNLSTLAPVSIPHRSAARIRAC